MTDDRNATWIPDEIAAQDMSPDMTLGFAKAYQELLDTDTLTVEQLRERGIDPETPDLIHLADRDGVEQYPAFQFNNEGIIPIVLKINRFMEVEKNRDHMAGWQWWACDHAYLPSNPEQGDRRPCSQIGVLSDERLFALAHLMVEDL